MEQRLEQVGRTKKGSCAAERAVPGTHRNLGSLVGAAPGMGRSLRYSVPGGGMYVTAGDGPGRHVLKGRFRFPGCLEFSPHHKSSQSFAHRLRLLGFRRHLICALGGSHFTLFDAICSQGNSSHFERVYSIEKVNRPLASSR